MRRLAAVLVLAAACSGSPAGPEPRLTYSLAPASVYVEVGQSELFIVHVTDAAGARAAVPEVHWSSADTTVFSVDAHGMVTGRSPGIADVLATVGDTTVAAVVFVEMLP